MKKYIIDNIAFNNKKQIKEKVYEIQRKYSDYVPIHGNDLSFILDMFKQHSRFIYISKGMTDIYFAPHSKWDHTRCVHIAYGNKDTDIKNRPNDVISWISCLQRIKETKINGNILNFGKYKGKTVEEVCKIDRSYLEWILKEFKQPEIKNEVKKHIHMNTQQNTIQTTMQLNYNSNKNQKRFTKPIAQYDLKGNLIRTYASGLETATLGYNPQCVSKCVNNKMKLHNKSIFIKIPNKNKVEPKIDPTPFLVYRNDKISTKNEIVKETITIKPKGIRIGMFNKQKQLLRVFNSIKQIKNEFGHSSGVFDHLYGRIKTKNKIKNGYNDLYFFRKLSVGQTYTIGEKYDLRNFEDAVPRIINPKITNKPEDIIVTLKEIKTTNPENEIIPIENPIVPMKNEIIPIENPIVNVENKTISIEELKNILTPEPKKRNFIQRLVYLFTGE